MVPSISPCNLEPYTVVNCEKDGLDYKVEMDFNTLEKKWKKIIDKEEIDSKEKEVDQSILQALEKTKKPRKPRKLKKDTEQVVLENSLVQEEYLLEKGKPKLKVVLKHTEEAPPPVLEPPPPAKAKLRVLLKKKICND